MRGHGRKTRPAYELLGARTRLPVPVPRPPLVYYRGVSRRSEQLSDALHEYVVAHSTQPDEVLRDLADETLRRFGDVAGMQIGPEQGRLMTLLAKLTGAVNAIEVGTFTGYSSLCVARGLADGGRLLCCDVNEEWTSVARKYWQRAGLTDADKTGYVRYWDLIVPMIRSGGVILVDNTLSHGRVVDLADQGADVQGIRRFNGHAIADQRVELVLLPIGDGLTLARKL